MNLPIMQIVRIKYEPPSSIEVQTKFDIIILAVENHFKVSCIQLKGKSRKKEFAIPRHIALALLYTNCTAYSIDAIGHYFNRDHTTVIHSFQTVKDLVESSPDDELTVAYRQIVESLPFQSKPLEYRMRNIFVE